MNKRSKNTKIFIIVFSVMIFVISLTQTAITYRDYDGIENFSSIGLVLVGGVAVLGGGILECLVWLANPIYLVGLVFLYKENSKGRYLLGVATVIALSFTTWKEILVSENGRMAKIEKFDLGYWLWIVSLMTSTVGAFYYFNRINSKK